jgi:hypothetical protein
MDIDLTYYLEIVVVYSVEAVMRHLVL